MRDDTSVYHPHVGNWRQLKGKKRDRMTSLSVGAWLQGKFRKGGETKYTRGNTNDYYFLDIRKMVIEQSERKFEIMLECRHNLASYKCNVWKRMRENKWKKMGITKKWLLLAGGWAEKKSIKSEQLKVEKGVGLLSQMCRRGREATWRYRWVERSGIKIHEGRKRRNIRPFAKKKNRKEKLLPLSKSLENK